MRTEYAQPLRFIFLAALINTRVIDSMTVKMTNQINGTKRKLCFQCLIYFLETRKLEFIFSKPGKEGVAGDKATQGKEIVYNKTCCYVNVFYIEYMFLFFNGHIILRNLPNWNFLSNEKKQKKINFVVHALQVYERIKLKVSRLTNMHQNL